jgi:hypothetical protein
MRFFVCALALGLGALAATPSLALTFQAAPPRPDVALHLHSTGPAPGVLPAPGDLKGSFAASGRSQLGQGFSGPSSLGTTSSFSFGPIHGTTVLLDDGAAWNDRGHRDAGNPLSLTPPRP